MDTRLILLVAGAGAVVLIIVGALLDSSSKKQQTQAGAAPKSFCLKPPVIVLGLVLLAIGSAVAYCYISSVLDKRYVREKYGAEIVDLCKDPKGISNPANLPLARPPWKVVVLNDSGTRASWHDQLPAERRAADKASTNVVACVVRRSQVLETCQYTTRNLERVQYYVDVALFNAENYQMIAAFQVWGSTPETCPGMITRYTPPMRGDDPLGGASSKYFPVFYNAMMQTVR
jgi:hypothetical protein